MLRLLCIITAMVVLLQSGGMIPLLLAEQLMARSEMQYELRQENLSGTVELRLSKEAFSLSHLGGKELKYQGRFYDIRSMKQDGAFVIVTVVMDEKESTIAEDLESALDHESNDGLLKNVFKKIFAFHFSFQTEQQLVVIRPLTETITSSVEIKLSNFTGAVFLPPEVIS